MINAVSIDLALHSRLWPADGELHKWFSGVNRPRSSQSAVARNRFGRGRIPQVSIDLALHSRLWRGRFGIRADGYVSIDLALHSRLWRSLVAHCPIIARVNRPRSSQSAVADDISAGRRAKRVSIDLALHSRLWPDLLKRKLYNYWCQSTSLFTVGCGDLKIIYEKSLDVSIDLALHSRLWLTLSGLFGTG